MKYTSYLLMAATLELKSFDWIHIQSGMIINLTAVEYHMKLPLLSDGINLFGCVLVQLDMDNGYPLWEV